MPGLPGGAALTGLPLDASTAALPIIAVKIDNEVPARGQFGLDGADVVFEENVESMTRFIALFHSRQPAEVGPVRSARSGDLYILAAMNRPVLAWSGGNAGVTSWVESAAAAGRLVNLSALRFACYRREASRPRPHNLILSMACARSKSGSAGAARPLFGFQTESAVLTGWQIPSFDLRMDGVRVHWDYDAGTGRYLRSQDGTPHTTAGGVRISATNVVIAYCRHIASPVEPRSPAPVTVGNGRVVVNTGGVTRTGIWSRPTDTDPWTFIGDDGLPILLEQGTTWVELARA